MTNGSWCESGLELDPLRKRPSVTRLHVGDTNASAELSLAVESYGARHGIELVEHLGVACALWFRRSGRLVLSRQVGAVADAPAVEGLLERPLADAFSEARRRGGAAEIPGRLPDGTRWRIRIVALPEGAMAAIWLDRQVATEAVDADAGPPSDAVDLAMPRRLMALATQVGGLVERKGNLRERAAGLQRALDREAWKLLGQRGVGLPVDLRAVPLTAKLEAIQARINLLIPGSVQSEWDIPPGLAQVAVPAPAVRYIVEALTRNAVVALGGKAGRLRLRGGVLDIDRDTSWHGPVLPAGTYVFIEVTDSGGGISSERVDHLANGREPGSLQAIGGLARGWNGGLRIRSSPGRGTIVQVAFPAHGIERNTSAVRKAKPSRPSALVVMDAGPVCSRVASGLELLGLDVVVAGDTAGGMDRFRERVGHGGVALLAVSDVLSDGTGFGLARRMREMAPTLPVVLMTDSPVDEVEDDLPDLTPGRVVPLQYAARMAVGAADMLLPRVRAPQSD